MGKIGKLRKKFTAFVNQLTPEEVREQLILAYLQMEQCQRVLRGDAVEPITMMDNGESSDLELFYRCKKMSEECAYLNQMVHDGKKVGSLEFEVKIDTNPAIQSFKELREQFQKMAHSMKARVLTIGTEVYYMSKGSIHKSVVEEFVGLVAGSGLPVCRVKGNDNSIPASYLFDSAVRLASTVGKTVSNHVSVSSDHECAYYIDNTCRVFKGAKWYLQEQKIACYDSVSELRNVLLRTIVDDTKSVK